MIIFYFFLFLIALGGVFWLLEQLPKPPAKEEPRSFLVKGLLINIYKALEEAMEESGLSLEGKAEREQLRRFLRIFKRKLWDLELSLFREIILHETRVFDTLCGFWARLRLPLKREVALASALVTLVGAVGLGLMAARYEPIRSAIAQAGHLVAAEEYKAVKKEASQAGALEDQVEALLSQNKVLKSQVEALLSQNEALKAQAAKAAAKAAPSVSPRRQRRSRQVQAASAAGGGAVIRVGEPTLVNRTASPAPAPLAPKEEPDTGPPGSGTPWGEP